MTETATTQIFMPEGQCARCNDLDPVVWSEFNMLDGGVVKLGFCSQNCLRAFVKGMDAIKDASRNTTQ